MNKKPSQMGFTLLELMMSLTLFSVVILFSYQIFKADHKVFVEQIEVVDMQQNARIALDQLVTDIRLAGAGVPTGGVDSDFGFLHPVIPGDGGTMPDTIKVLSSFTNTSTELSDPMPNESAILKVTDASDFVVGSLGIIRGSTKEGGESAEVFQITHVSTSGQHTIQHKKSLPWNKDQKLNKSYRPPSTIHMTTYRTFYIDSSDEIHPRLMIVENGGTPQVLADNIENLQFEYDLTTGETDVSEPDEPGAIRKVTVTLVARTATPDPQWNNGVSSITGSSDYYRRLTLTSDVKSRNLNP
jgi:prepilin-type N-terminal cleavage/methylation domain-containing protein